MAKKPKETLSVDIGTSSIKILVSERDGENITIKDSCFIPTFPGNNVPRTNQERTQTLIQSLAKGIQSVSCSGKLVHTAVSGQSVIVRYIQLPRMNANELKSAIKYEAEGHIPFNLNEVILDFQVIESPEKKESQEKMKVLLVAVKKDVVEERMNILSEIGMEAEIIDVDSFALVNAFEANKLVESSDATSALINIGANMTNINLLKGNTTQFSRDIAIAGNSFTKAIQTRYSMGYGDAESLKKEPGDKSEEIIGIFEPVVKNLTNEIQLSFDYYENQIEKGIDSVFLSGGCAALVGCAHSIQEKLGIPLKIWDPFKSVSFANEDQKQKLSAVSSMFPVAVGLSMR